MTRPKTYLAARLAGFALAIACLVWASSLDLSKTRNVVLVWVAPLLAFPISRFGRKALDREPEISRAIWVTVLVHYGVGIVLGVALFPAIRAIESNPVIGIPVIRETVWALLLLTGVAMLLTVVNLALRGLGAPFVMKLSTRLATDWLYARSRNPMLLSALAWLLCLGIWHRSLWFVIFWMVSITPAWIYFVKVYEERELEIRFGTEYREYRKRTPFLLPRLTS